VRRRQPYSAANHFLLSIGCSKKREFNLVMFTVYIDDSGTSTTQPVAVASAIIIPSKQIAALESVWTKFAARHGFTEFHTSECVARNPKKEFANWDDAKVQSVIAKIRGIAKKFGIKAFSVGVHKADYDHVIPAEIIAVGGNLHYTWAVRHLIRLLDLWAVEREVNIPFEYVFDWIDPKSGKLEKAEIETVMAQDDSIHPGRYEGHYSFRKRVGFAGLQCADLLAWSCYQFALHKFKGVPLLPIAKESFTDFERPFPLDKEWLTALTVTRPNLKEWVERESNDPVSQARRAAWLAAHPKKKTK
jgi:Protein of unknown function (DUF3800)